MSVASSAAVPKTAFTPTAVSSWTSIATRESPTRNGKSLKTTRLSKTVVAIPEQTRRVRVSHRRFSAPTPFPFFSESNSTGPKRRRKTSAPSKPVHSETNAPHKMPATESQISPESLAEEQSGTTEVIAELVKIDPLQNGLPHETEQDDDKHSHGDVESETNVLQLPGSIEEDRVARRKQRKERAQQVFLAEQLEKRQLEKLAKKAASEQNQTKTQKRVRSAPRSKPSASSALKDSFQAYMNEISREDLLEHSEIITLAHRIKESVAVDDTKRSLQSELGRRPTVPELAETLSIVPEEVQKRLMLGTAAKNTLVSANLRLVTSVARKVAMGKSTSKAGLALEDMIQEGSVGLIRAAEKFDAARGYRFSTYATWWIRAYVMRSISTQSRSIKVPSTIVDEYARIRKEYARWRENGSFKPKDSDVARALGITPAKLRFVVNVVTRVPTSLDIRLNPSGDNTNSRSLGEVVEGSDHIEERMVEELARKELDGALRGCLKPLERAVIRLRFGLDDGQARTLRETGALLGLSKERIRQIIFRALPKMKTPEIQRMLTDATTRCT